jgi:hypothetical protein
MLLCPALKIMPKINAAIPRPCGTVPSAHRGCHRPYRRPGRGAAAAGGARGGPGTSRPAAATPLRPPTTTRAASRRSAASSGALLRRRSAQPPTDRRDSTAERSTTSCSKGSCGSRKGKRREGRARRLRSVGPARRGGQGDDHRGHGFRGPRRGRLGDCRLPAGAGLERSGGWRRRVRRRRRSGVFGRLGLELLGLLFVGAA